MFLLRQLEFRCIAGSEESIMTASDTEDTDEEHSSALWEDISDDVKALFGDNVDISVKDYDNHLDVRIVPNGAVEELKAEHEDLTVVPYNACHLTIRKEKDDEEEASE
jgi:hypothetical protein